MAKKNPFKSAIYLSIAALVLFLINYFVIIPQKEKSEKNKAKESLLFSDTERADVLEITLQNSKGNFVIKKKADAGDGWLVVFQDKEFEGDKTAIEGLISTLLAAKRESETQEKNFATLGLAPSQLKVVLKTTKSKNPPEELWLGSDTPVDYHMFAKWSQSETAFLTSRSLKFSVEKELSDLRNKKILSLDPKLYSQVTIKTLGDEKTPSQNLSFAKENKDAPWNNTLSRKKMTLESGEIDKWISSLNSLAVTGFVSENPAQRAQFGFRSPIASINVTSLGPDGKSPKTEQWQLAKAGNPVKYYFANLSSTSTYEVSETFRDNFKIDLMRFRPKKILSFDKPEVHGISITDGKTSIEFTRAQDKWGAKAPETIQLGAFKEEAFIKMLDSVFQLKAQSYNDNISAQAAGLTNPQRVIEFRGQKDGQEIPLGTLFVGSKLKDKTYYVRSQGLDAPAVVEWDLESLMPVNWNHFTEVAQTNSTLLNNPTGVSNSPEGKKKMKLEATVKSTREIKKLPAAIVKPGHKYTAKIELSTGLMLGVEFAADKAPYTVSNFLHLARNGYYDGVKFHRVIAKFVVQGGDPTGTGAGGPGYEFDNEDNDLKHVRGALSMAHRGRNTNGSQFFIVLEPQPHLDNVHPVFGKITEGLDKIDTIKQGDLMKKVEVFEEAL